MTLPKYIPSYFVYWRCWRHFIGQYCLVNNYFTFKFVKVSENRKTVYFEHNGNPIQMPTKDIIAFQIHIPGVEKLTTATLVLLRPYDVFDLHAGDHYSCAKFTGKCDGKYTFLLRDGAVKTIQDNTQSFVKPSSKR